MWEAEPFEPAIKTVITISTQQHHILIDTKSYKLTEFIYIRTVTHKVSISHYTFQPRELMYSFTHNLPQLETTPPKETKKKHSSFLSRPVLCLNKNIFSIFPRPLMVRYICSRVGNIQRKMLNIKHTFYIVLFCSISLT